MELLKDYQSFVDEVTSDQSKNLPDMIEALEILEEQGVEPSRLLTAATGLAGECGEFNEIIKKCLFQGKAMDEERIGRLSSEIISPLTKSHSDSSIGNLAEVSWTFLAESRSAGSMKTIHGEPTPELRRFTKVSLSLPSLLLERLIVSNGGVFETTPMDDIGAKFCIPSELTVPTSDIGLGIIKDASQFLLSS